MKRPAGIRGLQAAGVVLCILPTLIAVCECFPVWVAEGGETVLSGLTATLLCLCAIPLLRLLRKKGRAISLWPFWGFLFLLLSLLRRVLDGLVLVAAVSFFGGLLGEGCLALAAYLKKRQERRDGE